jgi:hypothetical protein
MKAKEAIMSTVMHDPQSEVKQIINYNTNTMSEKVIYCGSGKKQNDTWLKATINVAKFKDHISEYEGHKFIKLNINIKDELDQYGKDVSISVDTWKPEEQAAPVAKAEEEDTLPF